MHSKEEQKKEQVFNGLHVKTEWSQWANLMCDLSKYLILTTGWGSHMTLHINKL